MSENEIILNIPSQEEEPPTLFSAEGMVVEPTSRGAKGGPSRSNLESFRPGPPVHRFTVGVPVVYPLTALLTPEAPLSPSAQYLMSISDFFWVQLACSMQPASGFQCTRADFTIELVTQLQDKLPSPTHALVFDMAPQEVVHTSTTTSKWSLSPDLKITSPAFEAQVGLPAFERTVSREEQQRSLEAFGLQQKVAGWTFTRTPAQPISMSYRLFLLLQRPKATQVTCNMSLAVKVQRGSVISRVLLSYFDPAGQQIQTPQYTIG